MVCPIYLVTYSKKPPSSESTIECSEDDRHDGFVRDLTNVCLYRFYDLHKDSASQRVTGATALNLLIKGTFVI